MELCQHLRMLFNGDDNQSIAISELQTIVNTRLDKDYSVDQIIIGLDYAGFKRDGESYHVIVKSAILSTDQDLYISTAKAFNNNDVSYIEAIASDDITLTIKHEVELVAGKSEVIQYLKKKFQNKSNVEVAVMAELAHMGDQSSSRQEFTNLHEGDLCLCFQKGILKPHGAILVLDIDKNNMVSEICICVLVHSWSAVIGAGIYPK